MKKNWKSAEAALLVAAFLLLFSACRNNGSSQSQHEGHDHSTMQHDTAAVYTCPMHPEVVRNEPGQCPVCNMDLVKKEAPSGSQKDSM